MKILNVNTSDNTFFCNFILTCKWEDQSFWPVVEGSVDRSHIDMTRHFVPEYDITNLVALSDGLVKEPQFDFYRRKDSNTVRVIMKQVRGVSFEYAVHDPSKRSLWPLAQFTRNKWPRVQIEAIMTNALSSISLTSCREKPQISRARLGRGGVLGLGVVEEMLFLSPRPHSGSPRKGVEEALNHEESELSVHVYVKTSEVMDPREGLITGQCKCGTVVCENVSNDEELLSSSQNVPHLLVNVFKGRTGQEEGHKGVEPVSVVRGRVDKGHPAEGHDDP